MTLNYSNGNDIIVTSSTETYRGLDGDDTYIISKGLYKNSDITIIDTNGKNTIQLIDDINLTQTKISEDAIQFVLSNNAKITINGADKFQYELSGNSTSGEKGEIYNFEKLSFLLGKDSNFNEDIFSTNVNFVITRGGLELRNIKFQWNIKDPEEVGIDPSKVEKLIEFITEPSLNTQAAILIQNNNIISEYYIIYFNKIICSHKTINFASIIIIYFSTYI